MGLKFAAPTVAVRLEAREPSAYCESEVAMYVTIRRYEEVQFPDEAAAKVQREFLPIISKIPGFQEYYAIKTGDAGRANR